MSRPKVFRDPIHENIEFDRNSPPGTLVLELLDTPEVQRLRHVRQLGLANLVYHGVEHSRFSHSLGVAYLAAKLLENACRNSDQEPRPEERLAVLAAALLHDTGHPPFSHAVEKVLDVAHEELSLRVVQGDTAVHDILDRYGGESLVETVAGHIAGTSDSRTTQIISSQLDADRLDYVMRDGFHAGVPNTHYDLARILQLVQLDNDGIWFEHGAQFAIESYLIARYHLYLQLYYHRTVRSAEALLRATLRRARLYAQSGADIGAVAPPLQTLLVDGRAESCLNLSDHDLWSAFGVWRSEAADGVLSDLCGRLLHRHLLKVREVSVEHLAEFYEQHLPVIQELARDSGFDPDFYVLTDSATDTPYKIVDLPGGGDPRVSVRLSDADDDLHALETQSPLIQTLQREAYQKIYVCFPNELCADVDDQLGG